MWNIKPTVSRFSQYANSKSGAHYISKWLVSVNQVSRKFIWSTSPGPEDYHHYWAFDIDIFQDYRCSWSRNSLTSSIALIYCCMDSVKKIAFKKKLFKKILLKKH